MATIRHHRHLTFPILKGVLGGMRWSPWCGGKTVRVFLGSYEKEQTGLMRDCFQPGANFIDIGAHHGYYTLMASRYVGATGKVISFEPSPKNFKILEQHVLSNQLNNVERIPMAVGDVNSIRRFQHGHGTGTGRLSETGETEVSVVRLDDVLAKRGIIPSVLKIDVEGAEMGVFRGATQTLRCHRPAIFLSTHGKQVHQDCCEFLSNLGYDLSPILGGSLETTTEIYARSFQEAEGKSSRLCA